MEGWLSAWGRNLSPVEDFSGLDHRSDAAIHYHHFRDLANFELDIDRNDLVHQNGYRLDQRLPETCGLRGNRVYTGSQVQELI